jgi:hypothetical protein
LRRRTREPAASEKIRCEARLSCKRAVINAAAAAASVAVQIDDNNNEQNARNCGKLNPRGPVYDAGLKKLNTVGAWAYQSTRENNFSNRWGNPDC